MRKLLIFFFIVGWSSMWEPLPAAPVKVCPPGQVAVETFEKPAGYVVTCEKVP